MKFADVAELMKKESGFRVCWEARRDGCLFSEYTPERGEPPFQTEDEAWAFASKLADALGPSKICNVYIVHAHDFSPVPNYRGMELLPLRPAKTMG